MRDLVYLLLTVGFFGLTALFVVACDRIVGADPNDGAVEGGLRGDDAAGHGDQPHPDGDGERAVQLGVTA